MVLLHGFSHRIAWYVKTPVNETTTSSTLCLQEPPKSIKVRKSVKSVQITTTVSNNNLIFDLFLPPDLYFLEDSPELFHYLSQSGCLKDKSLNDKELFNSVMVSVAAHVSLSPLSSLVSDLSRCTFS